MNSAKTSSAPTISDIKQKSRLSMTSAAIIIPLVVTGALLGKWQFGNIGSVVVSLVAFILGVFIEMHLIAWRLGISRNMMVVCRGLNPRGNVENFGNSILYSYSILRRSPSSGPWLQLNLNRLADDLLKGLNALSHFPDIEGFRPWEDKFDVLVQQTKAVANHIDKEGVEDLDKLILDLRLKARSYFMSIIEHITGG